MAGSSNLSEGGENPVAINVAAMVDIIFCLCIFFFCTFKFRQTEMALDAWLPRDRGTVCHAEQPPPFLREVRISLRRDPGSRDPGAVVRRVGSRRIDSDENLVDALRGARADFVRAGLSDFSVVIDSEGDVPWKEVVTVLDICPAERMPNLELTSPAN
jgi:biopolymer transport protein ExbD